MQINRLLEMTLLLLNKGTLTARELGERFGVSTRTIYRDIDVLSAAGVPVYASRGAGGGISLLEDYVLQKSLFSDRECESILFALKSLQAVQYPEIEAILDKLGGIFRSRTADWVEIDLPSWKVDPNERNRLGDIKAAILGRRVLFFDYITAQNQKSARRVEPLKLLFKGRAWYLWSWDLVRKDCRLFRLSRIKRTRMTDIPFGGESARTTGKPREALPEQARPLVHLELRFSEDALYRLYDDYDEEMLIKNPDGTYTLHLEFPEDGWVYGYILSFGPAVEVVSPAHIRDIIREKARRIAEKYPEI